MSYFSSKYNLSLLISWEYYDNSFHLLLSDFTHVEKYRTAPYTQADRMTPLPVRHTCRHLSPMARPKVSKRCPAVAAWKGMDRYWHNKNEKRKLVCTTYIFWYPLFHPFVQLHIVNPPNINQRRKMAPNPRQPVAYSGRSAQNLPHCTPAKQDCHSGPG